MRVNLDMQNYIPVMFKRDSLDPNVQKRRSELYNGFFDSLFDSVKIEGSLSKQSLDTLDSLLWATCMGYITLRNERGRQIWNGIFDYVKKHDINSFDLASYKYSKPNILTKEGTEIKDKLLREVQNNLYASVHPPTSGKGICNYLLTEGLGMLVTGITVGLVAWYSIAEPIERRIYQKFFESIGLFETPKKDDLFHTILQTS